MFTLTVIEVCKLDNTMRDMGMRQSRDLEMDRYRIHSRTYEVLNYYTFLQIIISRTYPCANKE